MRLTRLLLHAALVLAACSAGVAQGEQVRDASCALADAESRVNFRFVDDSVYAYDMRPDGPLPPGTEFLRGLEDEPYIVRRRIEVSGRNIADARASPDPVTGAPAVHLSLDEAGTVRFGEMTRNGVGRIFAVVIDDVVIAALHINEPISGGMMVVSGSFTEEEAEALAEWIKVAARSCAPARLSAA